MVVFTIVFFLSYSFYKTQKAIISIGIDATTVNLVVMLLSVFSIARIVFLIKDVEVKIRRSDY